MGTLIRSHTQPYPSIPIVPARGIDGCAEVCQKTRPGDLILVRTPGFIFSFGRKLSRNTYDHVAVVINDSQTLNIVNPNTVIVPVEYIAKPNRSPLILRPVWENPLQAAIFVKSMGNFKNTTYDLHRTLKGVGLVMLDSWLGLRLQMNRLSEDAQKWICTEAIILNLKKAMPRFKEINRIPLDYYNIGFATTNDLLMIAHWRPDLLRVMD